MTEISDVLRDNTGSAWNISAGSSGELLIQWPDAPAEEWVDSAYTSSSWSDSAYSFSNWENYYEDDNDMAISPDDYGAVHDGITDDIDAINNAIIVANSIGYRTIVRLDPAQYLISGPILLLSNVTLDLNGAELIQTGASAISQSSGGYVTNAWVRGGTIKYSSDSPAQTDCGLLLRSINHSCIEDIIFEDFDTETSTGSGTNDGQIIVKLAPNYAGTPAQNCVGNVFRRLRTPRDSGGARIVVWYEGLDDSSTPDPDPASGSYSVTSSISGNTWYDIWIRSVTGAGIYGKQWADSEKYFGGYMQANEDNVVLINLNTDDTNWWQIDRFNFYGMTLTYAPDVNDESTINAFRIGPGAFRIFGQGIITDKEWTNFLVDNDSISYYISGDPGDGYNSGKMGVWQKNMGTFNHGSATVASGSTQKVVTHGMRRRPTTGEIILSPRDDLDGRDFWISGIGDSTFTIDISSADGGADHVFAWMVNTGIY